jgi:hypothetical protein
VWRSSAGPPDGGARRRHRTHAIIGSAERTCRGRQHLGSPNAPRAPAVRIPATLAPSSCERATRGERPAPVLSETPRPHEFDARCERRSAAAAAGAGRQGDSDGMSHRAVAPGAHRAGCDRSSNPHSSACGRRYATRTSLRISSRTTTAGIKPVGRRSHKAASRKCRGKRFLATELPANGPVLFFPTVSVRHT